ncbi:MAG: hypothetical protein EBU88_20165, partial [Acidobacteria bacterium]|nr:hypothetical protein [Acidobacteriota bacterium]
MLEIGYTIDPFVAHTEAKMLPTSSEATDTVADSGATQHMFKDIKAFRNYKTVQGYSIKVADGKVVPVLGMGDVGPLKKVLHVPSLVYNLISESVLDKEGKWVVGGNGQRIYYERSSGGAIDYARVFLTATLNSTGLYLVNPMYLGMKNRRYNYKGYEALASKVEAVDLLHRTLGHISLQRLQDWVATGQIKWTHESPPVNFVKISKPCVACSMAKSKRASHSKPIRTPLEPGQLIYVDVWGPNEVASL